LTKKQGRLHPLSDAVGKKTLLLKKFRQFIFKTAGYPLSEMVD